MNPDLTVKPVALQEPTEPEYDMPNDDNLFDKDDFEVLRTKTNVYEMKLAKFDRQQELFGGFVSCNQATINLYNFSLIQK